MRLVEGPCKFGGCLCQILPVTCEHSCWRDITSCQLEEGREGEGRVVRQKMKTLSLYKSLIIVTHKV